MSEPLHSRLSPSASSRWVNCPASVRFLEDNAAILPVQDWSYADEGTRAHLICSTALIKIRDRGLGGMTVLELVSLVASQLLISKADLASGMVIHCTGFVQHVLSRLEDPTDVLYVEKRVPLFYFPEQKGTVDASVRRSKVI